MVQILSRFIHILCIWVLRFVEINGSIKNHVLNVNVETLAEKYPYLVALYNVNETFVCAGTIVSVRSVITTSSCVIQDPAFIVVGQAVIHEDIQNYKYIEVASTKLYPGHQHQIDYKSVPILNSDIGLVIAMQLFNDFYLQAVSIGKLLISEIANEKFAAIGFGKIFHSNIVTLQEQIYTHVPCENPTWHYCICGLERHTLKPTHEKGFGRGAAVIFQGEIVAITAFPCGSLRAGKKLYNIFTVLGPYIPWIEKATAEITLEIRSAKQMPLMLKGKTSKAFYTRSNISLSIYFYILSLFINILLYRW